MRRFVVLAVLLLACKTVGGGVSSVAADDGTSQYKARLAGTGHFVHLLLVTKTVLSKMSSSSTQSTLSQVGSSLLGGQTGLMTGEEKVLADYVKNEMVKDINVRLLMKKMAQRQNKDAECWVGIGRLYEWTGAEDPPSIVSDPAAPGSGSGDGAIPGGFLVATNPDDTDTTYPVRFLTSFEAWYLPFNDPGFRTFAVFTDCQDLTTPVLATIRDLLPQQLQTLLNVVTGGQPTVSAAVPAFQSQFNVPDPATN